MHSSHKPPIEIRSLLFSQFNVQYGGAALRHFTAAIGEYQEGNWDSSIAKAGNFVEAVLKMLAEYTHMTWMKGRKFKADQIMDDLARLQIDSFDDSIRLSIPRNCRFVYDVASNRGARHDPHDVDANKMDAIVVISCISWVLAELVRLSSKGNVSPDDAAAIIDTLMEKRYPYVEDIDGRLYVNREGLSAREVAILLLDRRYPSRIGTNELVDLLKRHTYSEKNAKMAIERIQGCIDVDDKNRLRLRGNGRSEASAIYKRTGK